MSKFQRVGNIILGLITILLAAILFIIPKEGFYVVIAILSIGLTVIGVKEIVYFFTMAIHMVGGKRSLYRGVIILEIGLFTMSLYDVPRIFVLLYLVAIHAFSGGVDVLRAFEAKKNGSSYRLKLSHGIMDLLIAASCLVFMRYGNTATYIYAFGLVYSSVVRIISSFKKTAIVYIQ